MVIMSVLSSGHSKHGLCYRPLSTSWAEPGYIAQCLAQCLNIYLSWSFVFGWVDSLIPDHLLTLCSAFSWWISFMDLMWHGWIHQDSADCRGSSAGREKNQSIWDDQFKVQQHLIENMIGAFIDFQRQSQLGNLLCFSQDINLRATAPSAHFPKTQHLLHLPLGQRVQWWICKMWHI